MQQSDKKQAKLELYKLLELKEQLIRSNPLKYFNPYTPKRHEKQIKIHESQKRIRIFLAGNRTGKTEWGGMETTYYATGKHPFRDIPAGIEIWAGCPSYDVQKDTTQKKIDRYLPKGDIEKVTYVHSGIYKEIVLKNRSKITFKSYEQGREKWQGAGKRLIWFDEEPPKDIWEEALMRHEAGQTLDVILTMTPINGMTWIYDDLFMATDRDDIEIVRAGWDDNPYLLEEQKKEMGRGLTEDAIKVRKFGDFVNRVGLVMSWWDRELMLQEYPDRDRTWAWYETLDGGWSDPTAYLMCAIDNVGDLHVVDGFREKELMADGIFSRRESIRGELEIREGIADNDNPRLLKELSEPPMNMELIAISKVTDDTHGSWDEQLTESIAQYGVNHKIHVNKKLSWLVQEIENLKWLERKSDGEYQTKPLWDDHRKYGHHFDGVRALCYLVYSQGLEMLELKKEKDKRVPGTYVKPLEDEDESDFASETFSTDEW